ncbi:hypothetical protein NE237_001114 [Protea cynaroides]|uniref:Dof zinc finger protein n=1 Tax=Protea cynaroides TaxID=273540 RepID=A0A9Q0KSE4_9MAGN|nr:hypothetical protein NE237_001114 [Protea cynaroides]
MLSHCEKMITSSPPNEWPQQQQQQQQIDETRMGVMEKAAQEQALKCPRCDSSNTKFCYYNNYSLSQPRHFCKACKRYWTRGGTLRNVPVGGGCRKNKRVKRSSPNDASPSSSAVSTPTSIPPLVSTASTHINPLFYSLPNMGSPSEINNPTFPSYDLLPQLNALGLGFSSEDAYRIGFNPSCQIQDVISTNPLVSNYSLVGSSSSAPSTAYLIASSLHQQLKDRKSGNHNFQAFLPFEELQMGVSTDLGMAMKEVKLEEGGNNRIPCQNPIESIGLADTSLYWNNNWADLNNFGSSVTPLI